MSDDTGKHFVVAEDIKQYEIAFIRKDGMAYNGSRMLRELDEAEERGEDPPEDPLLRHAHTIVEICHQYEEDGVFLTDIVMDCPVMPRKTVVTTRKLEVGMKFDPHFSNPEVIARLGPEQHGWARGIDLVKIEAERQ